MTNAVDATFSVSWTHRLRFTHGVFASGSVLDEIIAAESPPRVLSVIDDGLAGENPAFVEDMCAWAMRMGQSCVEDPLLVPGGEATKNTGETVRAVLQAVEQHGLCRRSCVLVAGGGAVLDAVGYAASIAHRGVRLVRLPSTSLAQCDSGVGVKNGVNLFGKKNFTGVFDPPLAVINDFDLLKSLDDRHWRSGLSEAVKVAVIKDSVLFDDIESSADRLVDRDQSVMEDVVRRSALLHFRHITDGGDPFELLAARPLDFGHWSAHKLEQMTENELTHGEAVSVGLALDLVCAELLGILDAAVVERILGVLQRLRLPTAHPALSDSAQLLEGIEEFREHLGGRLTLLMLSGIGSSCEIHALDGDIVARAADRLL
jgi:3-dehydroquinate synthase